MNLQRGCNFITFRLDPFDLLQRGSAVFPPTAFFPSSWGATKLSWFPPCCVGFRQVGLVSPKLGLPPNFLISSRLGDFHQVGGFPPSWVSQAGFQPKRGRVGSHQGQGREAPSPLSLDRSFRISPNNHGEVNCLSSTMGNSPRHGDSRRGLVTAREHALLARAVPPFLRRWLPIATVGCLAPAASRRA